MWVEELRRADGPKRYRGFESLTTHLREECLFDLRPMASKKAT